MNRKTVIYLAGVGGCGKTSVLDAIKAKNKSDVWVVPSPTRSAYAVKGVATEKATFETSEDERTHFQNEIFNFYLSSTSDALEEFVRNPELSTLILDRSPFDYASYHIQTLPSLTRDDVQSRIDIAREFMASTCALKAVSTVVVAYFPYPVPWDETKTMDDGMRYAPHAKNYSWNAVLRQELFKAALNSPWYAQELEAHSIERRANEIELMSLEQPACQDIFIQS